MTRLVLERPPPLMWAVRRGGPRIEDGLERALG